MGKVFAAITTSVDGYVAGPDDSPGRGLGIGGERLHYWVFGGPWTYAVEPKGQATGADREWLDNALSALGAVIAGRWTYEAADHWGGSNPWDVPFFIVTHRHEEQPDAEQGSPSSATSRRPCSGPRRRRATSGCTSWAGPTSSDRPSQAAWSRSSP